MVTNSSPQKQCIDLFFTPAAVRNDRLKGYNVVVIDVLRAATSITTALSNGARDVIPALSINSVIELASDLKRDDILLCGERDTKMVEGFHLGNSPAEFTSEKVMGRTLIFGTTNGTPAVVRASVAEKVFLCCFANLNAVVESLSRLPELFPFAILCSGILDSFAMEDVACGGLLIQRLQDKLKTNFTLNDAGKAATVLHREFCDDILSLLNQCDHGVHLKEMGMEGDLALCASDSTISTVPILQEGSFVNPVDTEQSNK